MITARFAGASAAATVTVTSAVLKTLTITPVNATVPAGDTKQLKATGKYSDGTTQDLTGQVSWTSNNLNAATISSPGGLVTGVAVGTSTIQATLVGVSGTLRVTVTPALLEKIAVTPVKTTVAPGSSIQYQANASYSDDTTKNLTATVTWTSSNTAAASISSGGSTPGLATAVKPGVTTIKATLGTIERIHHPYGQSMSLNRVARSGRPLAPTRG